jgi:hypothetical protein
MKSSTAKKVLEIASRQGALRPRDLDAHGIPRKYLNLLYHAGLLNRIGRGMYTSPQANVSPHVGLMQAAKWVPFSAAMLAFRISLLNSLLSARSGFLPGVVCWTQGLPYFV